MAQFWLNILLFALIYGTMFWVLRWKNAMRKSRKQDGEGDGGIAEEINWDPDLDLPPGVVLPGGPPVSEKKLEEELV